MGRGWAIRHDSMACVSLDGRVEYSPELERVASLQSRRHQRVDVIQRNDVHPLRSVVNQHRSILWFIN